jgi:two-component system, LytTR family, sensor kinase
MLIGLASLLRLSLEGSASQTVPLKEELSFADQYLDIQLARFRDRLDIHRAIDPKVMVCKVPFMLLQPLLENAIEHGVCRTLGPACITIRAQLDYDNLRIEIESPKPAFNKPTDGHGMGLSMTHARLATLYAGQYSLSLTPTDQQTMLVAVSFPASADVLDFDAFLSVPPREVAGVLHG